MYRFLIILLLLVTLAAAACGGSSDDATPTPTLTATGENKTIANPGDTVKVHYTGTLGNGTVFDTSRDGEPMEFTLGDGTLLEDFDQAVNGMKIGETKTITIPAEEAYPYDEELVIEIDRSLLEPGLEPTVGTWLQSTTSDGQIFYAKIIAVSETTITLDGNHPLAGEDLIFEIELMEIM